MQNTPSSESLIRMEGLSKSFEGPWGAVELFRDLNLTLSAGETMSIRGESGCGKTTLLHILAGIEPFDTGELYWENEKIIPHATGVLSKKRGRFLSLILQSYYLLPELNILENVLLPKRLCGNYLATDQIIAMDLLKKVGLQDRMHFLPQQLSGGERQRVALARGLIQSPRLILADEPTGNLDEKTGKQVIDLLFSLTESMGIGLMMVTHHVGFAKWFKHQLYLEHGALVDIAES